MTSLNRNANGAVRSSTRCRNTAENIAKAILFTPPKKPHEWKFMREFEGDTKDLKG